jgi:hypothetical protein
VSTLLPALLDAGDCAAAALLHARPNSQPCSCDCRLVLLEGDRGYLGWSGVAAAAPARSACQPVSPKSLHAPACQLYHCSWAWHMPCCEQCGYNLPLCCAGSVAVKGTAEHARTAASTCIPSLTRHVPACTHLRGQGSCTPAASPGDTTSQLGLPTVVTCTNTPRSKWLLFSGEWLIWPPSTVSAKVGVSNVVRFGKAPCRLCALAEYRAALA